MPSDVAPGETKLTIRFSVKTPRAVVYDFVNAAPRVTGVGLVKVITVPGPGNPGAKPVLSVIMLVTESGAPDEIEVAVVTSPVLAVKVPFGTKLNVVEIATAEAGLAPPKIAQATAAINTFRGLVTHRTYFFIVASNYHAPSIEATSQRVYRPMPRCILVLFG
jgi:hypothetical protein